MHPKNKSPSPRFSATSFNVNNPVPLVASSLFIPHFSHIHDGAFSLSCRCMRNIVTEWNGSQHKKHCLLERAKIFSMWTHQCNHTAVSRSCWSPIQGAQPTLKKCGKTCNEVFHYFLRKESKQIKREKIAHS